MSEFFFTQTALKDLEKPETCPLRWKKQWIDKEIQFPSNEAMIKGKYFEQLVIGAGAIEGDEVNDLPRLKNGDKSTDQLRIEAQAERAKRMLFTPEDEEYLGLIIKRVQYEMRSPSLRKGTWDIEAEDKEGSIWLVDLKLTSDLTSDRTPYSWGHNWDKLDLIQLPHYQDLYFELFGVRPRMALLVMDYTAQKRAVFGEIVISDSKLSQKEVRFTTAEQVVALYNKHGWPTDPSIKECETCPLLCKARINANKLIKKIINY